MLSKFDKDTYYKQLAVNYRNTARMKRCKAAVHLESDYDKKFWVEVFKHYMPDSSFEYITYSRTMSKTQATGCAACLKYFNLGCLSDEFFICIDSDYRRLLQQEGIDVDHYIFQTYTYSLENHYCYYQNVSNVFGKMGLGNQEFDFKEFFEELSRSFYTLFIHHLISLSENDHLLDTNRFNPLIQINRSKANPDIKTIIADLNKRIQQVLSDLKGYYTQEKINAMKDQCYNLGLREDNTYLYLRGHNVFDQVVLPIIRKLKAQIEKVNTETYTNQEKEIYYKRSLKGIEEYLLEDIHFEKYPEITMIENDIKRYIKKA